MNGRASPPRSTVPGPERSSTTIRGPLPADLYFAALFHGVDAFLRTA